MSDHIKTNSIYALSAEVAKRLGSYWPQICIRISLFIIIFIIVTSLIILVSPWTSESFSMARFLFQSLAPIAIAVVYVFGVLSVIASIDELEREFDIPAANRLVAVFLTLFGFSSAIYLQAWLNKFRRSQ